MFAIFKREFKSYFSSPIGYVVLAVLLFLFGFFFYQILLYRISDLIASSVYGSMFTMCMMVIPIITMKSLSEDKKNKTDQALITAPVGVTSIVFGKFLAAFCVYAIAMCSRSSPRLSSRCFPSCRGVRSSATLWARCSTARR